MHLRTLTRRQPAPAVNIEAVLDIVNQLISVAFNLLSLRQQWFDSKILFQG
jgi:hypothetical protein